MIRLSSIGISGLGAVSSLSLQRFVADIHIVLIGVKQFRIQRFSGCVLVRFRDAMMPSVVWCFGDSALRAFR